MPESAINNLIVKKMEQSRDRSIPYLPSSPQIGAAAMRAAVASHL